MAFRAVTPRQQTRPAGGGITSSASRILMEHVLPRFDQRLRDSVRPFDRDDLFRPHHDSRLWGWTHFGVFLPDLPDPYRYLNTMTLIGATGATCFDNDHLAAPDARNTATVLSSTAHADQHHYASYDASTDCTFARDGQHLRWGDDLALQVDLPHVTVDASYATFDAHIELTTTTTASWFVRSPVYDHVSLLAPYHATIRDREGNHDFTGLGTVEYARCLTPQSLRRSPLPASFKLPFDFFTYQIINLDAETQLLLTDVRVQGSTACRLAHVRTSGGRSTVYTSVTFEVVEAGEPLVDPIGRTMRAPARMRWAVRDEGRVLFQIEAVMDAPWRFGHGRGYVSAYSYTGQWRSKDIAGRGYVEWVDCEQH